MVLARLIESSSKAQVPCVLGDLGLEPVSVRTLFRSLGRCIERDYRQAISAAALKHAMAAGDVSLCLYGRHHALLRDREGGRAAQGRLF